MPSRSPPAARISRPSPRRRWPRRTSSGSSSTRPSVSSTRPSSLPTKAAALAQEVKRCSRLACSTACERSSKRPRGPMSWPASCSPRSATPRCSRYSLSRMADVAFEMGDLKRSEKLLRESIRLLAPLGQHRELAESQAELGRVLAEQGKTDEAERFMGEAQEYLPSAEPQLRLVIVLGARRSTHRTGASGRGGGALPRGARDLGRGRLHRSRGGGAAHGSSASSTRRGQNGKAATYEERLAALVPAESAAEIA